MSRVRSEAHKFSAVASVLRMQLVKVIPAGKFVLYMSVNLLLIAKSIRETCVSTVWRDGPFCFVVLSIPR